MSEQKVVAVNTFTPGQLAKMFNISTETVRVWERDGKIPAAGKTPGGHRRFTGRHVDFIARILNVSAPNVEVSVSDPGPVEAAESALTAPTTHE